MSRVLHRHIHVSALDGEGESFIFSKIPGNAPCHKTHFFKKSDIDVMAQMASGQGSHYLIESPTMFIYM